LLRKIVFVLKEKFYFFRFLKAFLIKDVSIFKQPLMVGGVFLVVLIASIIVFNFTSEQKIIPLRESDRGIIGGPILSQKNLALLANNDFADQITLVNTQNNLPSNNLYPSQYFENEIYYLIDNSSLQNPSLILTSIKTDKNGILIYKVQKGDSLLSIASEFGVSLNTIIWANGLKNERIIPGEELIILPVSGVLHEIKAGDTIESIAKTYSASIEKIIAFNNLIDANLQPGQKIIVPDGKLAGSQFQKIASTVSSLPDFPYYYIIPTTGFNWGILHPVNAVDIANRCGTPVMAAAEGLVVFVGWDNGYGSHIKIQHPNNTETLYAHLNKALVKEGDYIIQGQLIGLMGNTGYVLGNSGCHLHFEVRGAKNPFAK